MTNTTKRTTKQVISVLMIMLLGIFATVFPAKEVNAASSKDEVVDIIDGGYGTIEKTLTNGDVAKVVDDDGRLLVTVGTETYKFRDGSYSPVVGMACVADDDLLHIFTFDGSYYVVDLRYASFACYRAYKMSSTNQYVRENTTGSYQVVGKSFYSNLKYFTEYISSSTKLYSRLVTRAVFEVVSQPENPEEPDDPTPTPVTKSKYVVSFNTNGGSYIAPQMIEEGDKVVRPTDPTRSGYTFAGWYSDSAFNNSFNFDGPITAETTLYAKWTLNQPEQQQPTPTVEKYVVSFNTNGGSYIANQTIEAGNKAVRPTDPTRTGYTFDGWYSDSELKTVFDFDSPINTNVIVYAKWVANNSEQPTSTPVAKNKYMVSFDTNGGSYVSAQFVESGDKAIRPTDPTKSGYTFAGWYTDSALNTNFNFDSAINTNTIVYAKWTANSSQQPTSEQPTSEQPTSEQPKSEQPASEQPKTETPTTEAPKTTETKGQLDIDLWWQRYIDGLITKEQFDKLLETYNWEMKATSVSTTTTYYFYDNNNNLVRTYTESTGHEVANGTVTGETTGVSTENTAVKVVENGKGEIQIKVDLEQKDTGKDSNQAIASAVAEAVKNAESAVAKKGRFHVVRRNTTNKKGSVVSQKVKLQYNGKGICTVYWNTKKHYAKFDGIKYKNIIYVGYNKGTKAKTNILMTARKYNKKTGKYYYENYIVPRAKGKINKVYTKRVIKGNWKLAIEDGDGFVIRLSDKKSKVYGVINATPKKISKKTTKK